MTTMQSKYNDKSKIQLETIKDNSQLIVKSIDIMIDNIKMGKSIVLKENSIIRILDIGSSHGRNSLTPLNLIISNILKQFPQQTFEIYHEDLPENDFSKLFKEISNNQNSYLKLSDQIYYYGIGNSFYNQVVPSNSIDFVFSFSSSHWSTYNSNYFHNPDSLVMMYSERSPEYAKHCNECLVKNFQSRAKELKNGGIYIITVMLESDKLTSENDTLYLYFKAMKTVWKEMSADNMIPIGDVEKMILPINFYKPMEVDQAIKEVEQSQNLKLVTIESHTQQFQGSYEHLDDEFEKSKILFGYINAACEPTIKSFISGSTQSKELLYKVFKLRFLNYIKLNNIKINNLFNYYSIIFEKDV